MPASAPDFKPGDMLPGSKYRIVKQIGAGGMGVVYQVVKPPEIQGVLKLMSSDLTGHEEFRTRFLDEVRVLAQLDHPNIVKVSDYDFLTDGTPFYVMELLHGRTVRDVLQTMGTIPPRVAFEIVRQLCEALHCAHTHDIPVVHRDIKPENIFLHAPRHGEPVVKLIDFGVVAVADRQHDGAFVGTWNYAAPEQIRGERATPATDLYAVGLVLYEMLCGNGPFAHHESGPFVAEAHVKEIPAPVSKFAPWVPPSIVQLIDAALAKDPRRRPRDAYGFAERLYELEWANDGKDPNERTAEGPLSRILSTVGTARPSSKNLVAAKPQDRLANVPVIGVPPDSRHEGPTIKGVGQTQEPTSPGEDALLAGLLDRADLKPLSKKARLEATPRMPIAEIKGAATDEVTTQRLALRSADTDTFSSQESDTRRAPRGRGGRLTPILVVAVLALVGIGTFVAYRARTTTVATPALPPVESRTAIGVTGAELTAVPPVEPTPAAPPPPVATPSIATAPPVHTGKGRARPTAPAAPPASTVAPAPAAPAASKTTRPDESFDRSFH